ncbi:MAG: Cof-type HAD-IIB family hydrolase [Bacteroidales bacterium]
MCNKRDYKILVLDLDGTLTNKKKEITPRTKAALMQAQEKGVRLVLASGRPTYGIVPLAEELEMARYGGYILSYNGGTIINWETKDVIHASTLDMDMIAPAYEMARRHGVEILSYIGEDIISEDAENKYVQYESMLTKMKVRKVADFCQAIKSEVPKCLIVGESDDLVVLEKKMQELYSDRMNIYRSEAFYLELNPPAIDKANSLQHLLDHLHLTPQDMIACGDGYNDLSMICFAGLGIAMENAQQAVKEVADFITLSNEEDGVAHVVDKYLL